MSPNKIILEYKPKNESWELFQEGIRIGQFSSDTIQSRPIELEDDEKIQEFLENIEFENPKSTESFEKLSEDGRKKLLSLCIQSTEKGWSEGSCPKCGEPYKIRTDRNRIEGIKCPNNNCKTPLLSGDISNE